jgi:hypothetical protein
MTALTTAESRQLASHEETIRRELDSFVKVGNALMAIREGKLYRAEFATFSDYCTSRWGLTKTHCNRLISAARVVEQMAPTGVTPPNERQARELGRLPEDQRAETWREVVEQTDGKPTARDVHEAVEERIAKVIDVSPEFLPLDDSEEDGSEEERPSESVFNLAIALARIENAIIKEIDGWPEEYLSEAAHRLEVIAKDLRNGN